MQWKSDNTKYPDPKNFIEWLILKWNNIWDEEYQESKKRYERLHRHDQPKMSKSEKSKAFLDMKRQAKQRR